MTDPPTLPAGEPRGSSAPRALPQELHRARLKWAFYKHLNADDDFLRQLVELFSRLDALRPADVPDDWPAFGIADAPSGTHWEAEEELQLILSLIDSGAAGLALVRLTTLAARLAVRSFVVSHPLPGDAAGDIVTGYEVYWRGGGQARLAYGSEDTAVPTDTIATIRISPLPHEWTLQAGRYERPDVMRDFDEHVARARRCLGRQIDRAELHAAQAGWSPPPTRHRDDETLDDLGRRLYRRFWLRLPVSEIARVEHVARQTLQQQLARAAALLDLQGGQA